MYYLALNLYSSSDEPLKRWVVELKEGQVVALFPFDGERASMLLCDKLFLSRRKDAKFYADIKCDVVEKGKATHPLFLYSATIEEGASLCDETPLLLIE